jgi:hypothetical protein
MTQNKPYQEMHNQITRIKDNVETSTEQFPEDETQSSAENIVLSIAVV